MASTAGPSYNGEPRTLGQHIATRLVQIGVTDFFGVPGASRRAAPRPRLERPRDSTAAHRLRAAARRCSFRSGRLEKWLHMLYLPSPLLQETTICR